MSPSGERFAVYFAPAPGTPLDRFGSAWLGYDAASGESLQQPSVDGFSPQRLAEITAEARRYGFHATLKPPFALAPGSDREELEDSIADFARRHRRFQAPPLALAAISGFLALVLSRPCPEMRALAAAAVEALDRFRAATGPDELAKRRRAGLSPVQDALLLRWGYPYVMDEFRFHMTLTARLDAAESAVVRQALAPLVTPLGAAPLEVDAVTLFHQPAPDAAFRAVRRFPLSTA